MNLRDSELNLMNLELRVFMDSLIFILKLELYKMELRLLLVLQDESKIYKKDKNYN